MSRTYMINAWCQRPFIATIDIEAATPEQAIAIVRQQLAILLGTAVECNDQYPWDEFVAYEDNGQELMRVLDSDARLREAAAELRDTVLYVAHELSAFKPDFLRRIGLHVALEHVEKALALADNTSQSAADAAKTDDQE